MTAERIAIIDTGTGNLRSVCRAVEHCAHAAGLAVEAQITSRAGDVADAERIILPGQGAFGDVMQGMARADGLRDALEDAVRRRGRPFLGICVGMQVMASMGFEGTSNAGLGWIPGEVVALDPEDKALRIPHMGWNKLELTKKGAAHPVLSGLREGAHVYFVHSWVFRTDRPGDLMATASYGGPVTAIVARDNMIGTQFHTEKSQHAGLAIISGFLQWRP